jgi:hypothetical protein
MDVVAVPGAGFLTTTSLAGAQKIGATSINVPTDWLRFVRIARSPLGQVAVIGQGGGGEAWLIHDGVVSNLGPTFGTAPVAVRFEGETLITYRVGPGDYAPLYVNGVETQKMFAVEGIREVLSDGTVVKAQATAAATIQGRPFGQYTDKDGWVVGQAGYTIGCLHKASGHYFTARRGTMAEGIHFAVQPTGALAVVALTEVGGFSHIFVPPYPAHEPLTAPPPPDDDVIVVPPPPPPDEEPPAVKIPQKVKDNIQALYERHKDLAEGDDDDRRALMRLIAEQNAFDLGERYGWKASTPTNPPSKDATAYTYKGEVYVADVFNGTTRQPSIPDEYERTNPRQHFIAMTPINHLGEAPPPPDEEEEDDDEDIPVDLDLDEIFDRLDAIENTLKRLDIDHDTIFASHNDLDLQVDGLIANITTLQANAAMKGQPFEAKGEITFALPGFLGGRTYRLPVTVKGVL